MQRNGLRKESKFFVLQNRLYISGLRAKKFFASCEDYWVIGVRNTDSSFELSDPNDSAFLISLVTIFSLII